MTNSIKVVGVVAVEVLKGTAALMVGSTAAAAISTTAPSGDTRIDTGLSIAGGGVATAATYAVATGIQTEIASASHKRVKVQTRNHKKILKR